MSAHLRPRHRALQMATLLTLGTGVGAAHAELWAYVDAQGTTHYAAEQIDSRYKLYSKTGVDAAGVKTAGKSVQPVSTAAQAKVQSYFASQSGYKQNAKHLQAAAREHGVDEKLLKAIASAESSFNAQAVSPKGAIGLMQVIPDTAKRFGVQADKKRSVAQKLKDPAINAPVGARYVSYLQSLFPGRLDLVLAAYNAGEGAVKRYGNKIPPYKETQNYVKKVMKLYQGQHGIVAPQLQANQGVEGTKVASAAVATRASSGSTRLRMTLPAPGTATAVQ